jgi:hypothetical protein
MFLQKGTLYHNILGSMVFLYNIVFLLYAFLGCCISSMILLFIMWIFAVFFVFFYFFRLSKCSRMNFLICISILRKQKDAVLQLFRWRCRSHKKARDKQDLLHMGGLAEYSIGSMLLLPFRKIGWSNIVNYVRQYIDDIFVEFGEQSSIHLINIDTLRCINKCCIISEKK